MEVDQLGQALGRIKAELGRKIDVFATDACLMQMAGVAYEFRNSAEVIVGSEETIPGDSFPYHTMLAQLAGNTRMGAEGLGTVMVDTYGAYYGDDVTLSALRTSALPGFVARIDDWIGAVKADPQAFQAATSQAVVDAAHKFAMKDSKDLYDYLTQVNGALAASPEVKNSGDLLMDYIANTLIIRDTALPSMTDTHGLAIYIPNLRYNSANYEKLAFATNSQWGDFLLDMMEERRK